IFFGHKLFGECGCHNIGFLPDGFARLKSRLLKSDINRVKTKLYPKQVTAFLKQWSSEYVDLLPGVIEAEINPRRRRKGPRRVPIKIAFELARAIHFCSGDGVALKRLREYLVRILCLRE